MDMTAMGGGLGEFLKVVAAMALIYWLMATVSSFIIETVSSMMNVRGNALRQFAVDMVQGEIKDDTQQSHWWLRFPTVGFWGALLNKVDLNAPAVHRFSASLFEHSLMKSLEQPLLRRGAANVAPSYMPSSVFAQTIIDRLLDEVPLDQALNLSAFADFPGRDELTRHFNAVMTEVAARIDPRELPAVATGYDAAVRALTAVLSTPPGRGLVEALAAVDVTFDGSASDAVKAAYIGQTYLRGGAVDLTALPPDCRRQLPATFANIIRALGNSDVPTALKEAMNPLVQSANQDLDALSNSVAVWYDQSMERASGWYKRNVVIWLFGFGLVAAILFNVDTPRIVTALINDPALRDSGYAAASQVVAKDDTARQALPTQIAFLSAAKHLCETGTGGKCKSIDKKGLERLVFLTASPNNSLGFLQDYHSAKGLDDPALGYVKNVKARCEAESGRCSASKGMTGEADTVADDLDIISRDIKLFWYPSLLPTLFGKASTTPEAAIDSAVEVAKTATGGVTGFTDGLPGVGPIATIYETENWRSDSIGRHFQRLLGWLLTAAMVSIGAPFWFDLMQNIVNKRASGPKPAEADAQP